MIRRTNRVVQHYKDMRGFTIIELMVAVAIISILATTGFYSMIDSRRKTQDIVALAEVNSLGKTVIEAVVDGADINFAHAEGDGSAVGGQDTSGSARKPIFFFSKGVRAQITGNTQWGDKKLAFCEAHVWYAGSDKLPYILVIDEENGINSFPEY